MINSCSRPVLSFSFSCSFCGSNCPLLIIRGFPFKGNNPGTHLSCYNVIRARNLCRIDNLLPHQVQDSDSQCDSEHSDEECRDYLPSDSHENQSADDHESTDDGLIDIPITKFTCQYHISGYVCLVLHEK